MVTIVDNGFDIDLDYLNDRTKLIFTELKLKGDITIKFGDANESKTLNFQYRKEKSATDVLSFPINEDFSDSYYIGDIHICFPIAKSQARSMDTPLNEELLTLICHGILHLTGYDHETDSGEMFLMQDRLIQKFL